MENNKTTLENIARQAANNSSMPVSDVTRKTFQKKLIVSNFWHFSFYNFNIFYSAAILLAISIGTICLLNNRSNNRTIEQAIYKTTNKQIVKNTEAINVIELENENIDNTEITEINNFSNNSENPIINNGQPANDNNQTDNLNNSIQNTTTYISRPIHKTIYDTTTVVINKEVIIDENNAE